VEAPLVAIGAVVLVAAIAGGAVEGAGVKVPVIAGTGRQVAAGLVGLVMLVLGLTSRWLPLARGGREALQDWREGRTARQARHPDVGVAPKASDHFIGQEAEVRWLRQELVGAGGWSLAALAAWARPSWPSSTCFAIAPSTGRGRSGYAVGRPLSSTATWPAFEDGNWAEYDAGTPQGATASPLLANVYLHYVFDLWAERWRRKQGRGDVIIVRYCDDFIVGFQHKEDADRFWADLMERFARFGLELKAEKTRLIEFGRFAVRKREARGLGKPETFDFLGFTHICGKTRAGEFRVLRKTVLKRRRTKLRELYDELKQRRHLPIPELGKWVRSVAQGHLNYYAVPGNLEAVSDFIYELRRLWMRALQRRSQKTRMTWPRFSRLAAGWLPRVRNMHPYPDQRFAAIHPR